jgi:hypothetical protein
MRAGDDRPNIRLQSDCCPWKFLMSVRTITASLTERYGASWQLDPGNRRRSRPAVVDPSGLQQDT